MTSDNGTKITATTMPAGGVGLTGWLSAIFNVLGSPFQAGGSIGNTSFGVSSLPGSPMQATGGTVGLVAGAANIGTIGNTTFGATLPTTPSIAGGSGVLLSPSNIGGTGTVTHSNVTTGYTANQLFALNTTGNAVATQITVTATAGGTGYITDAKVLDSGTGGTAPPGYTFYLFSASPTTTGLVDRSAYVGPYAADLPTFLGALTCASFVKTNDATAQWQSSCSGDNNIIGPVPYKTVSGQTYVFALAAVNSTYTPIASEALTLIISATRDQ